MIKKIFGFALVMFISLCSIQNISAQAFQKGSKNLSVGIGFGAYGTSQKATTTIDGTSFSTSETDGAASTIIPIVFEYGISDKFGLGAEITYNNYFINDSDRVSLNKVSCIDFGINANFHLLSSEKNDLFVGVGLGFSSMYVDYVSSPTQSVDGLGGTGMFYSIGITDKIYFSDHIGILFNLGYRGYNYASLEADFTPEVDQFLASAGVDYSQTWEWKFSGVHIGTGIAVKF